MNSLNEALNERHGCDSVCCDGNPDNKQVEYHIRIVYSKKLYSLDDVTSFVESFKTVANERYTAMFNDSDFFVYGGSNPNQNIIEIKGFHSKAHASNYIEIIEGLKDTFGYDRINIESYAMLYNNTYSSEEENNDNVNHPNHYIQDGIETIDVIKAWTKGLDGIIAFDTGNVIKYISRWNKKNGLEDLRKAQWYLNHLIKEMEERMENDCEITVDEELEYLNNDLKAAVFPNEDPVNHPNHYIQDGIETIDVIKAWTKGLDGIIATDTGNVIKYISRWNKKNGIEDLKKAQWYLNHLIKEMEERMENDCCC